MAHSKPLCSLQNEYGAASGLPLFFVGLPRRNTTDNPHIPLASYTGHPYSLPMHSVLETSYFTRRADALLSRDERMELIATLATDPLAGDEIPGTGGVRKLRFGAGGRGKRGGFRVVYYVLTDAFPIVAITLYGKNEKSDLTEDEKRGVRAIVTALKNELKARKRLA